MKMICLALTLIALPVFADTFGASGAGSGEYSRFSTTAQECGETNQAACTPDHFGGRTMCGRSVAQMIACMGKSIGKTCLGNCGDGKGFVDCENGQLKACGYEKVAPGDERCKKPGAVLAYQSSPTSRGQKFGHVEFVCGENKYCSVYKSPHTQPWPKAPPDGCWFPASGSGQ
jgi:hypothetical protein